MQQANIDFMTHACIIPISNVPLLAHKGHIKAANVNFCIRGDYITNVSLNSLLLLL